MIIRFFNQHVFLIAGLAFVWSANSSRLAIDHPNPKRGLRNGLHAVQLAGAKRAHNSNNRLGERYSAEV